MRQWLLCILLLIAVSTPYAVAHEVRPAYLELRQTAADTFDVLWKVPALGDHLRLGLYVRLPETCVNLTEPHGRFETDAYIERWRIRHAQALAGSTISVDGLRTTLTDVLVRIERLDGTTQVARLLPANPSLVIEALPSGWQVAWTYLARGVEHILFRIDYLLFVLALVLLVQGWQLLAITMTAFTVAHSMTLAAATLGFVSVPGPPVEACIALSSVFVAAEIIRSRQGQPGLTERAPWLAAFTFGLLHGLGFAGSLSEVGLPQHAMPLALLFFNVGVDLGQLTFIALILPMRPLAWGWRVVPYGIGSVAMFWVIQRILLFHT